MKMLTGKVVSNKMKDAVVVEVVRFVEHKLYKKRMRRTKKFHAYTSAKLEVGDIVKITERSPMSKTINWEVIKNK